MEIKLVIDGSDMRVRLTPNSKRGADAKLLEFVAQMDIGRVKVKRETFGSPKDITSIDLQLEVEPIEPDETGAVSVKVVDYPISN